MSNTLEQLLGYVRAVWLHRWIALGAAWVIAVLSAVLIFRMPDRYEASARLFVDTQSILKPLMSGLAVQPNVEQELAILSRTLISRPNVEKVIRMADLDITVKNPQDKDRLVDSLMKETQIKTTGRDNLYTINFPHEKPEVAKRVVQSFLSLFVESSLGDKRKDTDSARRFLDEQIKAYEQKLLLAENALKEFKQRNMGSMPNQGKDYAARMGEAAGALSQAKLELREQQNARDALNKQLSGETPTLVEDMAPSTGPVTEVDRRIDSMKTNLDNLRLRYTEQHPDIVQTKKLIEDLEAQKAKEAQARKPVGSGLARGASQNPAFQQIRVALATAEANVAALQTRVAEYEARYVQLQRAANSIPQVEADLTALSRDYEVHKSNYEKLLARRESAQLSGDMEATSSLADFRIIDPPRVPPRPTAPNRALLLAGALLGSLGAGLVLAFVWSQIRPTFADRRELRDETGLPIFGSVSMVWNAAQQRSYRLNLSGFVGLLVILVVGYSAIAGYVFWTTSRI
jgi:polysaccharide chain length determinant protein (PEP-CTERM system associated)